jgi:hypothetical protein
LRRPLESALHAAITVVNEATLPDGTTIVKRLLQGIEDEASIGRAGHPPADDPPGVAIDHEGNVDKALPRRDIWVSRPEEFHLRPLAEPDVNLSVHPAPIIPPMTDIPISSA